MMDAEFNLKEYILHHMQDASQWQLPFVRPILLPPLLSLHGLMVIIGALILVVVFCFLYQRNQRVPRHFTNFLEFLVLFIRDEIAVRNLGESDGRRLTPFLCTLFFFILTLNLMGLVPVFSSPTANPNVTGSLAFLTLCLMILGTLGMKGWKGLCKAITPSGVPAWLLVLLLPLEIVGLFIKAAALMIRLFANMLAGHMVVLSMLGLVLLFGMVAIPSIILAVCIGVLEIFIAFLQAYIFTMLSAVFIGRMYHPEH